MTEKLVVDTEEDLGPVRHPIDLQALEKYLGTSKDVPEEFRGQFTGPMKLLQFKYGQSNPSYQLVTGSGHKFVLRKKPPGKLFSKKAHAIEREYHMINGICRINDHLRRKNSDVAPIPVPRVVLLCEESSVIGTPFYLMEFVKGRIFHSPQIGNVSPKERTAIWKSAVETLENLHAVNPQEIIDLLPKEQFGKLSPQSAYYPRQVKALSQIHASQAKAVNRKTGKAVGPIPFFDKTSAWLADPVNLPPNVSAIVHGDYKIDNLVFHPTEPRVIAILDWELCTIGHPLFDLSNLLQPFSISEDGALTASSALIPLGSANIPGLPSLDTLLDWADALKRDNSWSVKSHWVYATVFAHYRLAVITHGIAARSVLGQASSEQAETVGAMFPVLGKLAYSAFAGGDKGKL